jgi:hypothetical protein
MRHVMISGDPVREPLKAQPEHLARAPLRASLGGLGTLETKPFVEVPRSGAGVIEPKGNGLDRARGFHPLTEGFGQQGFAQPLGAVPLGYHEPAHRIRRMVMKGKQESTSRDAQGVSGHESRTARNVTSDCVVETTFADHGAEKVLDLGSEFNKRTEVIFASQDNEHDKDLGLGDRRWPAPLRLDFYGAEQVEHHPTELSARLKALPRRPDQSLATGERVCSVGPVRGPGRARRAGAFATRRECGKRWAPTLTRSGS